MQYNTFGEESRVGIAEITIHLLRVREANVVEGDHPPFEAATNGIIRMDLIFHARGG